MKRYGITSVNGISLKLKVMAIAAPTLLLLTAMAADNPSIERGKELFNGTTLGTNGKSCGGCHRDPNELQKAAAQDTGELEDTINQCIKGALKGKGLDPHSVEMKSLIMYIRSLAATER